MRFWRTLLVGLVVLVLLFVVGFSAYALVGSLRNLPQAATAAALRSGPDVTVTTDPWLTFTPQSQTPTTGVILYPGGPVPPQAYAPLARALAQAGYLVVLPDVVLNLAVLSPNVATAVIDAHPEIDQWVIGGHSLGGSMAAAYAHAHPGAVDGLVLLGAYPDKRDDLSQTDLPVLSIYGTLDGLTTVDEIEATRSLLPPTTRFVPIEGGNHTQFGWYGRGLQPGDNPATISREEQQTQIVAATTAFLATLDDSN